MSNPRDGDSHLNFTERARRQLQEEEALISDDADVDEDGSCCAPSGEYVNAPNPHAHLPVYTTIHRIRRAILSTIDDPYSVEQLKDPRMNVTVVRPLVDELYAMNDVSVIYCLLVNRVQFLREHTYAPNHQSVNITRASLCELIATRILRRLNENNDGSKGLLLLANVLVAGFDPFQNAPPEVIPENSHKLKWVGQRLGNYDHKLPALEIAIISESKTFLSSSACQKVVSAIYEGRVIYTPSSFIDIIPDRYKQKPISLYDPRSAPLLNQYRLIVPRTRNILELVQFVILLVLYVVVMADRDPSVFPATECVFCVYAFGWVLDQLATILEHGWQVYTQNLWSFLDVIFAATYGVYLILRLHSWRTGDAEIGWQAMDVLAMGAPVLVPRLAFNLMSENMLFVSLRAMMADFTLLTLLAVWCFAGFLLSMFWLSNGAYPSITIGKWMLWVWFGLDGTGIQRSVEFHEVLGPVLMVAFAFLGNTLFLTILVSMLSSTFANISANATAEIQFRRAVVTLEGVKSDAIFAYQPPFNVLALFVMLPLKFVISARWFHKVNVTFVRTINAPLLLVIGFLERRSLWSGARRRAERRARFRNTLSSWGLAGGFSVHGEILAVFDNEPPDPLDELHGPEDVSDKHFPADARLAAHVRGEVSNRVSNNNDHNNNNNIINTQDNNEAKTTAATVAAAAAAAEGSRPTLKGRQKSRRDSMAPFTGLTEQLKQMLRHHEEDTTTGLGDTNTRLEALEGATQRIESLLVKLTRSGSVGGGDNGGGGSSGGAEDGKEETRLPRGDIEPLEEGDASLEAESHT